MNRHHPGDGKWIEKLAQEARLLGEARMLRDEQELTPELAAAVIERFQQHLKRVNKSQDWAARSMGIGSATLSQVLSGSYAADAEKHIRALDKWLEAQIRREAAPKPAGFVKIGVSTQIYGVAKLMTDTGGIAVVHGPPGVGKTISLQAIRAETPGSVYISITTAGDRKAAVLESLAGALRAGGLKLTCSQLFDQIVSILVDTNRLVMVDEVHKLVGRARDQALHVLRDLHDATRCPMIWAGNSAIYDYLHRGRTKGYDPLEQIYGRVSYWLNLTEIASKSDGGDGLYTVDDICRMFSAAKMRLTSDAQQYLYRLANTPGLGALRVCRDLVMMAQKGVKEGLIDAEMLQACLTQKLGGRAAALAEQEMQTYAVAVA